MRSQLNTKADITSSDSGTNTKFVARPSSYLTIKSKTVLAICFRRFAPPRIRTPKKGYGFIVGPEGQDIFVHYTRIEGEGFRVLKDGSTVTYDAHLTDKGWHATRVVREETLEVTVNKRRGYARSPRR